VTDINKRFKELRKATTLSQALFAEIIGVSPAHVSMIESGKSRPSKQLIKAVCSHFSVSEDWLLHGTGPMVPPEKRLTPEQVSRLEQADLELDFKYSTIRIESLNRILVSIFAELKKTKINLPHELLLDKSNFLALEKSKKELKKNVERILKLLNDSSK
jgi:transcriptional regulator with XRE-family HTH domain